MQNYTQYGAQGTAPAYYSNTQQGKPAVAYTSTTGGAAASTYSYNMAPQAVAGGYTQPVAGAYTTAYAGGAIPSYGMSQSYTAGSGGQRYATAGLQVPGLIQAPSFAVAAAGPYQFNSAPVQEASGIYSIAEGSPMAESSAQSPTDSVPCGTPANWGPTRGFGMPETVMGEDPLSVPTAAALGPNPMASMTPAEAVAYGSATSYESSLPGTMENMVPGSALTLPTEQNVSGTYPGYNVPVSGASLPREPGTPETVPGTCEVLYPDAALPAYGSGTGRGPPIEMAPRNAIPATAPAGLTAPREPRVQPQQPVVLQPGMTCVIQGLDSLPGAPQLNGMMVTLVSHDTAKDKWVVNQQDGKKARVPSAALSPVPRELPGTNDNMSRQS